MGGYTKQLSYKYPYAMFLEKFLFGVVGAKVQTQLHHSVGSRKVFKDSSNRRGHNQNRLTCLCLSKYS